MKKTQHTFILWGLCCLLLTLASPALGANTVHKVLEPLNLKAPILVPLSDKQAQAKALSLQKERQGMSSWRELAPALERSLAYAKKQAQASYAIEHDTKKAPVRVTWQQITESLELLQSLLPQLDDNPALLAKHFQWLHVNPKTHFTSYFSPVMAASRTKKEGFTAPLYRLPEEVAPHLAACLPTHTCPDEAFTKVIRPDPPFLSRANIDLDGGLANRNLEIAWLKHPFDTYWFMLQGSGLLTFDDGSTQAVLFAGLNGHKGESMAGYLMRTKQVSRKNATLKGMRQWWNKATDKQKRAFLEASSGYAFFRYGPEKPQGSVGAALTPWVSMATDQRILPLGGILAYHLPTPGKKNTPGSTAANMHTLHGLGFAHDTGGAINMRRIDLYAGEGESAHAQARQIYTKGDIWLLLKK